MGTTVERLSVLETKVEELSSQSKCLENKVDILIDLVNKGNFDNRITKLEKKETAPIRWAIPVLYTVIGAVLTFLVINYLQHV